MKLLQLVILGLTGKLGLAAESAALNGTDLAASVERAVTATSAAVAGSKAYVTMSEKLLSLLEAA